MTGTLYCSKARPSGDEFAQVLRSEWVKFITVRGWVAGLLAAALAIVALGLGPSAQGSCGVNGPASDCVQTLGPAGEPVTDSFYFVHQPLDGNGSITVRVTALTVRIPDFSGAGLSGGGFSGGGLSGGGGTGGGTRMRSGLVPWAKAGIIIKASARPGSAYAAMMITGSHGVRMQYDYTGDVAASPPPGNAAPASAAGPRWLRLTRSGETITGYDSADGTHWAKVAAVTLADLPSTVQSGMFATSPPYVQTFGGGLSVDSADSRATGVFDDVSLRGSWPDGAWDGLAIGAQGGPATGSPGSFADDAGTFTVTGTGDIAPAGSARPGSASRSRRPSSACSRG